MQYQHFCINTYSQKYIYIFMKPIQYKCIQDFYISNRLYFPLQYDSGTDNTLLSVPLLFKILIDRKVSIFIFVEGIVLSLFSILCYYTNELLYLIYSIYPLTNQSPIFIFKFIIQKRLINKNLYFRQKFHILLNKAFNSFIFYSHSQSR